ncbi:unnamed protein product [Cylindrotheca closterium]|uniref:DDE Tnp4 domain-containing protein n=1 Tax=Cylindrotheca closterium TaxID=2856 RepID=A0AAD2CE53_9STRA|nr:unnamed protein product [Cylindrotheca closterium]
MRKLTPLQRRGRPIMHTASDILGLNLAWSRTKGSIQSLSIIFGMTATNVHRYLYFGRRILIMVLQSHPDAAIRIPSAEKIEEYKQAVNNKHNLLTDVWCCFDGLKLGTQAPTNAGLQRIFYNAWKADTFVKGVFAFVPDGKIVIAYFNVPGSVHDSQLAYLGNIYGKLKSVYDQCGGIAVGDSAFAACERDYIIKSSANNKDGPPPNLNFMSEEELHDYLVNNQATSLRQTSEWGMRGLQSSFPRLNDRIHYEQYSERKYIMKLFLLLYNLRASRVGINQITNTYMPHLNQEADNLFPQFNDAPND